MTLPYRYKEQTFLQQAELLGKVLNQFPAPYLHNPSPRTADYAAQALRDAIKSKIAHNWSSSLVSEALFLLHADKIIIRVCPNGQLLIGDRETTRDIVNLPKTNLSSSNGFTCLFTGDFNDISHLCQLIERRVFPSNISFEVTNITMNQIFVLEDQFDVALTPAETPNHYILL